MAKPLEKHYVALSIGGTPTKVSLQVFDDNSKETWETHSENTGELQFLLFPGVRAELARDKFFRIGLHEDCCDLSRKSRQEIIIYAAPRIAEKHFSRMMSLSPSSPSAERVECLEIAYEKDLKSSKEEVAGETYEQRSIWCYEDLCKIVLERWQDPHVLPKEFRLNNLKANPLKRRVYEEREWFNVLAWGEGDEFWSKADPAKPDRYTRYIINPRMMRRLHEQLSKASLGVLPEIVGRIEIDAGLLFLDGDLRDSVERDCKEINEASKVGAAKAVIVLCGSVVEAMLYDLLKEKKAEASKAAKRLADDPSNSLVKGPLLRAAKDPIDKWTACPIIKVANDLYPDVVSADAAAYSDVLRDYRNLIHPGKSERSAKSVDQYTAGIAIQVVNLVIGGRRESGGQA